MPRDPVNPPTTEAGRRLRDLYAVLPTTDEGWRLAEEWMTGPLLNEQHGSVPERIKRIEEQARVEGRQQAVRLLQALVDEVGRTPIEGTKRMNMGAWIQARNYLDRVAGLNASASPPPSTVGHHTLRPWTK